MDPSTLPQTLVFATNLAAIIAKYALIGKFAEGFLEALKRWFRLDEKLSDSMRDWAYPGLALLVVALASFGVHLLSEVTVWSPALIREIILATLATWAGLVGLVAKENRLADRTAGKSV